MVKTALSASVALDQIGRSIRVMRGHRVLLDGRSGRNVRHRNSRLSSGVTAQFRAASNKDLARQFTALESRHSKWLADHDDAIVAILSASREFMNTLTAKRWAIGFNAKP